MGLFSNNKKLCPICGNPTPRLLPTKIDGQPICKECDSKIDLPAGAVNQMSLTDFKKYLVDFQDNQALQAEFTTTYRFNIGFWGCSVFLDETHGLFRMKEDSGWVFQGKELKSFRISEDRSPLFESGSGTLKCTASDVPARVNAMADTIARFHMEKQEFERREAMEGLHRCMDETNEERRERERTNDLYRPRFDVPAPVKEFRVELTLDHPYWKSFDEKISAPEFDRDYPRAEDYLRTYREQTEELHLLASKLMRMIDPNAGETRIGGGAQSVQAAQPTVTLPTDAVSEIQKYKALLDAGVNEMRQWASLRVTCPYSLYDRVRLEAEKLGAVLENTDYGADITLALLLPEEAAEPFAQTLRELSAGRLVPEKVGSVFRGVLRK